MRPLPRRLHPLFRHQLLVLLPGLQQSRELLLLGSQLHDLRAVPEQRDSPGEPSDVHPLRPELPDLPERDDLLPQLQQHLPPQQLLRQPLPRRPLRGRRHPGLCPLRNQLPHLQRRDRS